MSELTVVPLRRPVTLAEGMAPVTELRLREPRAKDLIACGLPFLLSEEGLKEVNASAVAKLAADLPGQPAALIERLSAGDFLAVTGAVLAFLGDAPATPPA